MANGLRAVRNALLLLLLVAGPARATMPTPSGQVPPEVVQAFQAGLFDLPEHAVPTATSVAQPSWNVPVIMVGFSDAPLTISAAEMEQALFDTTGSTPSGSVYDYYRWVSGNRLRVTGRVVAVVNLPNTRGFYAYNFYGLSREATPQNLYGVVRDALLSCDGTVDWSPFDMDHDGYVDVLWVVHQGVGGETSADRSNLWSVTSRMSSGWAFGATFKSSQQIPGSSNQFYQVDRFSTLPELSAIIPGRHAEIGVFCHEFGHALGLPDLYDTSGIPAGVVNSGPGNWSLMSTGAYGGAGLTPERPTGLGAWCQLFLGWGSTVRPTQDSLITLRPIARGDPFVEVWPQGKSNPEHFIIENRAREGFDSTLPSNGLIVYHVDEGIIAQRLASNKVNVGMTPGLVLVEGDGDGDLLAGRNRGDANDPLPGALHVTSVSDETLPNLKPFSGSYSNLALGEIQEIGSDVQFQLQVRAPGWGDASPVGDASQSTLDSARPGRWARTDSEHRVYFVRSELVAGVPQILLYMRLGNVWFPPEQISNAPTSAVDPALTLLPGGDIAVVWTDVRKGRSQIFLRTRIHGAWQPEVLVSQIDGDSHHASVGSDAQGTVQVAWANDWLGVRRLYFKRFAFLAPFGMCSPFTGTSGEIPDPPALDVRPNGSAYLVWTDRAVNPPRLYFARYSPDSGVSARLVLTPAPGAPQLSPTLAVDEQGTLHVAWQVAGAGVNQLHYQARGQTGIPTPRDTTLESSGYLLQNPSIACDDSGGVHLAYENWATQFPVANYRLWTPGRGWDMSGTQLSAPDAGGTFPIILPHSTYDVTALFIEQTAADLHVVERRRRMGASATLDVPRLPAALPGPITLGPNPLRAGTAMSLSARGDGASFEIFDVNGRRVAEIPATGVGGRREARIAGRMTAAWAGGVYFARLRGSLSTRRFVVLR